MILPRGVIRWLVASSAKRVFLCERERVVQGMVSLLEVCVLDFIFKEFLCS